MSLSLTRNDDMACVTPKPKDPVDVDPLLDHLRCVGRRSRCKASTDLFRACAALSGDRTVAVDASSEVLMRCLSQMLGRKPVLLLPGVAEVSFDEAWLIRLARCLEGGDESSTLFLLRSRIPVHARRNLVFLLHSVTEFFPRV
jgi:hypothetical protein